MSQALLPSLASQLLEARNKAVASIRNDDARVKFKKAHLSMWRLMEDDQENDAAIDAAFLALKQLAVEQTTRLCGLIPTCMENTKLLGGPGYFRIHTIPDYKVGDSDGDDPDLAEQRVPPKKYRTDIDRVKYLLSMAAHYETEFRAKVHELAYDFNCSDTFAPIMNKYEVLASSLLPGADDTEGPLDWPMYNDKFKLDDIGGVVNHRFGPPKSFERALVKLGEVDEEGGGGSLKDLNRVTLEFADPRVMELMFFCIKSKFTVTAVKNKHNQESGFTQPPNLHVCVTLDNSNGWICEIQLIFKDNLLIKKELHHVYAIARANSSLDVAQPMFQEKDLAVPSSSSGGERENKRQKTEEKLLAQSLTMETSGSDDDELALAFRLCAKRNPMAVRGDLELLHELGDNGQKIKFYYMMIGCAEGDKHGYGTPEARKAARGGALGWGDKSVVVNFEASAAYFTTMGFHRYYWELGKWKALGLPISDEYGLPAEKGGGSRQDFELGVTYWKPGKGIFHVLNGEEGSEDKKGDTRGCWEKKAPS
jgi:hypothetical protein